MIKFLQTMVLACLLASISVAVCAKPSQPNVVLIILDDLNDYITGMGGHPQAKTPNLTKLAQSGVAFKHAYSNDPVCAPSRSSFLTGIYPHKSKNFFFDKWYKNPVLNNSKLIWEHFKDNGYNIAGTGKLMHPHVPETWQGGEFKHVADYGPMAFNGKEAVVHPSIPAPFNHSKVTSSFAPLSDVPFAGTDIEETAGWAYTIKPKTGWKPTYKKMKYIDENNRDHTPDERNAYWAVDKIAEFSKQKTDKPFFLTVGFIRPHTPLIAPKKYFDMFPLDEIQLPIRKADDLSDTYHIDAQAKLKKTKSGKMMRKELKGSKHFRLLEEAYKKPDEGLKRFTQAYLAVIAAADANVGRVIDAIDNSALKDNTIIVVVSDHGWHMGEKNYLAKNTLWEESTRIPFIVRAPGVTKAGGIAQQPVSLIDLYPTLIDLCDLKGDTKKNAKGGQLDGQSIRPFLKNPEKGVWQGPDGALSVVYGGISKSDVDKQNWAYRTKKWRYIRYHTGKEELYNHDTDPNEWTNLADNPEYEHIKKKLAANFPGK